MSKFQGQLEKTQAENAAADLTPTSDGLFYFNTVLQKLKFWDSVAWQKVFSSRDESLPLVGTTTPSNPAVGQFKFYIKSDGNGYVLDSDGNESLIAAQAPLNLFDRDSTQDVTVSDNTTLQVMRHRVTGGNNYLIDSGGGIESNSSFSVDLGSTFGIAAGGYLRVV